jgi:hypothetical protein
MKLEDSGVEFWTYKYELPPGDLASHLEVLREKPGLEIEIWKSLA